ncbi:MAG TPA: hypothetical protein VMK12_12420 [Anaeromyxobacteraceae bacterium]|nr:hypothetical protein [Anaeromyxobacteraceae bacterium]
MALSPAQATATKVVVQATYAHFVSGLHRDIRHRAGSSRLLSPSGCREPIEAWTVDDTDFLKQEQHP